MQNDSFDQPLYVSKRLFWNLWQEYRIYGDRIELRSCVGRKVIRAEDIIEIQIRPPIVIGDLFRRKGWAQSFAGKLDLADFFRHVSIHRRSGWLKHVRLTPDDPETFVSLGRSIMATKDSDYDDLEGRK